LTPSDGFRTVPKPEPGRLLSAGLSRSKARIGIREALLILIPLVDAEQGSDGLPT